MGDFMTRFYSALGMPLQRRVAELTYLIDTGPNKELQIIFPELVNSIFGGGVSAGWRLRHITEREDDFELISNFLVPQGPMFRLCYKLLVDSQLKYSFPIHLLPNNIYEMIQRGRYAHFYEDLLNIDPQTMQLESLYLNPFDYYIFHFAVYLLNAAVGKTIWEKHNTVYLGLVADYLTHFLPTDPNKPVLPYLPFYTGKVADISALQTNNRAVHTSSLLLYQDITGLGAQMNTVQPQPRNETWRSETVLQVFIDVWLSTDSEQCPQFNMFSNNFQSPTLRPVILPGSAAERVRIARMVVKQVHAYSGTHQLDLISNSALLRRSAQRLLRAHVFSYVFSLVRSWPLDASFRLVMELWLSYIQPWRYATDLNTSADVDSNENVKMKLVDISFMQFIADNLPAYTTIFQNVIPRFLRMDLTAPKNIVMLYRLSKVYAQQNLVLLLSEVEVSVVSEGRASPPSSPNSSVDTSSKRWYAIAKQAISDFKQPNTEYRALWGMECRELVSELMSRLQQARLAQQNIVHDTEERMERQSAGFFNSIRSLFSISDDEFDIDEQRKVLLYLNSTLQQFAQVFNLEESLYIEEQSLASTSSHSQANTFSTSNMAAGQMSARQAQTRSYTIKYMGDPDLIPIGTHENTFLVRILYQLSKWLNDTYSGKMNEMWQKSDIVGYLSREILCGPCTVQYYAKPGGLQARKLGPRLSMRSLAAHALLLWTFAGYIIFWLFGYTAVAYISLILIFWSTKVVLKACAKKIGLMTDTIHLHED